MQHGLAWTPDDVDIERPSVARMYDYFLGGSHNFASDRDLAKQAQEVFPDAPHVVRANRSFLGRAVAALCALGVDQFLDLGSGIPTVGNVHEIVAAHRSGARTVYVDSDPVAVAHASALLRDTDRVAVVHADLRNPDAVLRGAVETGELGLSIPTAVLLVSVLPFVPDEDDPARIVAAYRDATVPGSYLAISHGTNDYRPKQVGEVENVYAKTTQPGVFRGKTEVERFFDGYELLEPGLVDIIHWRPEPAALAADPLGGDVARYSLIAGVGRRRG
ncbi:SAM-dependent methyltransferase [Catenulispora yoronensis]|uniref:SAM-dependent methyltransferase n=1 Tax=Catenulispora yoronensis TaxID=450799 RepID=A0ABN2TQP5_9ACTN